MKSKKRKQVYLIITIMTLTLACKTLIPSRDTTPPQVTSKSSMEPDTPVPSSEPTKSNPLWTATMDFVEIQPSNTVSPPTPSPSENTLVPVPVLPSPTTHYRDDLILHTPSIIDASIQEVETILGMPVEVMALGIGEVEEVPDGGEERHYISGNYSVWVTFSKDGIAKGLQVDEGLIEDGYSLGEWRIILSRMGVEYVELPDVEAPAALRWNNTFGYFIMIASSGIGKDVWTVRIYKVP